MSSTKQPEHDATGVYAGLMQLRRAMWPLSGGLAVGFVLALIVPDLFRSMARSVFAAVDGIWPAWIGNLANGVQIAGPLLWGLAWLLTRRRHG